MLTENAIIALELTKMSECSEKIKNYFHKMQKEYQFTNMQMEGIINYAKQNFYKEDEKQLQKLKENRR